MLGKVSAIEARYEEINNLLEVHAADYQKVTQLAKEKSELEDIVQAGRLYQDIIKRIHEARSLQDSPDEDLKALALDELQELLPQQDEIENRIKNLLVPRDPRDARNVIMEIRAGTGGDEAGLFAADLFRMYSHYAERNNWIVDVLSMSDTGIGGIKEIIYTVKGKGAYSKLKYESGVHRVQRIPATESSGRIHTSTITVAVLAEVEEVDIQIPESDIRIDVYKSAGAGGQNVQKNSTAIRITHLPTGMVVACQDERSQLQNKLRALSVLRARLYDIELEKRENERDTTRRAQVGTGERAEKIRTYNFPQSRVTDHRINLSSFNLAGVLDGDLDEFISELSLAEQSEKLATITE